MNFIVRLFILSFLFIVLDSGQASAKALPNSCSQYRLEANMERYEACCTAVAAEFPALDGCVYGCCPVSKVSGSSSSSTSSSGGNIPNGFDCNASCPYPNQLGHKDCCNFHHHFAWNCSSHDECVGSSSSSSGGGIRDFHCRASCPYPNQPGYKECCQSHQYLAIGCSKHKECMQ